jgi:aerobic C4-dicarboxylate transport protein
MNPPLFTRLPGCLRNLTFWVLLSIVAGAITGYVDPELGVRARWLGDTFIQIIKLFIAPLIFLTITTGIGSMGDMKKVGRIGLKALLYFEVVTTFALVIGVAVTAVLQPGVGVVPVEGDVSDYVQRAEQFDWLTVLRENLTLQVLAGSILVGAVLGMLPGKQKVLAPFYRTTHLLFRLLRWVMVPSGVWPLPSGATASRSSSPSANSCSASTRRWPCSCSWCCGGFCAAATSRCGASSSTSATNC